MTEDEVLGDMIKACNADIKRIKKHALHRRKRSKTNQDVPTIPIDETSSEQTTEQPTPRPATASSNPKTGITLPITTDDPKTNINPPEDSSVPIVDIPFTQEDNNRDDTLALRTGT